MCINYMDLFNVQCTTTSTTTTTTTTTAAAAAATATTTTTTIIGPSRYCISCVGYASTGTFLDIPNKINHNLWDS